MGDLISRQTAIDEWKNDFKGYINALDIPKDDYKGIMEYIDELPSAQPGWIPVTERLPKANEEDEKGFRKAYLVQTGRIMHTARYDGKYWILWGEMIVVDSVVAWMPLPKRYEG